MRVIPVLDLMHGQVVRGVAGRREEYRPIVSRLAASADPLNVARAFRDCLDLDELYVADLDAIAGAQPGYDLYHELADQGFQLLVDAGVRELSAAANLAGAGVAAVVVGLETLPRPETLSSVLSELGAGRVVFSLDLQGGKPLGDLAAWNTIDAATIAREAIALGVRRLIVLDLAGVGVGKGVGTGELCRTIRSAAPGVELITGGGVRDVADLELLAGGGVDAVLVASALHDGRIGRADIDRIRTASRP
jgi:phosphoribosylformimino-5-aminoimidazole carboxamide ribotide isomerase